MKSSRIVPFMLVLLFISTVAIMAADGSWLRRVPAADRERVNPFAGKPEAVAAGKLLFSENCAKCHGSNAEGRYNRPSLRSGRLEHATDGELAWLLRNGSLAKGMPSWSSLPEPERWQLIAFLRSLSQDRSTAAIAEHQ